MLNLGWFRIIKRAEWQQHEGNLDRVESDLIELWDAVGKVLQCEEQLDDPTIPEARRDEELELKRSAVRELIHTQETIYERHFKD